MTQELSCEQFGSAKYDISYILLHDVLLMESRSFVMKYQATKNRKNNGRKCEIESEIDKIQNSPEDKYIEIVEILKNEHQKLEDKREVENAKFFCSFSEKLKSKAQFETVHIKEEGANGEEVIREVNEQREVDWEVRKFYWKWYCKEATIIDNNEILERIGDVKKISEHDRESLDRKISMDEVSNTLKNTRNNVAPGAGDSLEPFTKCSGSSLKLLF